MQNITSLGNNNNINNNEMQNCGVDWTEANTPSCKLPGVGDSHCIAGAFFHWQNRSAELHCSAMQSR